MARVEDVVNRGDVVTVEVVEVDKQRGRIGLKPIDLHTDARQRSTEARAIEGFELSTLEDGLRVVSERLPGVRSIALGVWIGAGSRLETAAQAGISHFIEHLIFKGSERYSAWDIARIFDEMGGEINAATSKEYTLVHARFLDEQLDTALSVIADMVRRPLFADLDAEREVVLEEVAMYEDAPQELVHDVPGRGGLRQPSSGTCGHRARRVAARRGQGRRGGLPRRALREPGDRPGGRGQRRSRAALRAGGQVSGGRRGGDSRRAARRSWPLDPRRVMSRTFATKETEQYHVCLGGSG